MPYDLFVNSSVFGGGVFDKANLLAPPPQLFQPCYGPAVLALESAHEALRMYTKYPRD